MNDGTACPISCGRCCGDCDRLTPDGCMDPREVRPSYCRTFLCEFAEAVIAGRIEINEALPALEQAWGKRGEQ